MPEIEYNKPPKFYSEAEIDLASITVHRLGGYRDTYVVRIPGLGLLQVSERQWDDLYSLVADSIARIAMGIESGHGR